MQQQMQSKGDNFDLKFWTGVCIAVACFAYFLLLFFPFAKAGIFSGHDAGAVMTYSTIFNKAISEGQIPVRIIDWITPGFNHPLFNFYQPGFYYLAEIFFLLSFGVVDGIKILVFLLWILSAILMFLFVKNLLGASSGATLSAVVAAGMYTLAPYHIEDVFVRSALPEFMALTFIPGLFFAVERFLSTGGKLYVFLAGVFLAVIILAHPPTLLMFAVPLLIFLLVIKPIRQIRLIGLILTFVLGFLAAGFYIIPALMEGNIISRQWLSLGYYNFHLHFVCPLQLVWSDWGYGTSQPGCMDGFSFQIGVLHWAALLFIIYYVVRRIIRKVELGKNSRIMLFLIASALFGIFLSLEISAPIWENTPYLPFLQYPWRFLSVIIFSTSVAAGFIINLSSSAWTRLWVFVIIIVLIPLTYGWWLHPATYYPNDIFEKGYLSNITPELGYLPKDAYVLPDPNGIPKEEVSIAAGEGVVKKNYSTFTVKEWTLSAKSPVLLHLYVHYFPGWHVFVDDKETKIDDSNEFGLIQVNIPDNGIHKITLFYLQTPIEQWANRISIASIILLLVLPFLLEVKLNDIKSLLESPASTTL